MHTHHEFDAQRFVKPGENASAGYAVFLGNELQDPDAVIFVAEHNAEVVGYIYASLEPQLEWKEARDRGAFIHDLVVDVRSRRCGLATALANATIDWLQQRGVPRATLWTASSNTAAQAVFARTGFRRTMVEMTREL
jgi:ribosomal protein S18 acetylase RimI-like enzyme